MDLPIALFLIAATIALVRMLWRERERAQAPVGKRTVWRFAAMFALMGSFQVTKDLLRAHGVGWWLASVSATLVGSLAYLAVQHLERRFGPRRAQAPR